MDESTVRQHAEAHGSAVVSGDLKTAGSDLTPEAASQAREVMGHVPQPATAADIVGIESEGEEMIVTILYKGADKETTVLSTWAERDGRPKIVNLSVG
ncbi:MAG: hypothetical protein ACRDLB_09760 [Actinomycetota bacterium]